MPGRRPGTPLFRDAAVATADWVIREMQSPEGGYWSTLDADSEGHEGRFYAWQRDEVRALLTSDEYPAFAACYGLDRPANFEGAWHLHGWRTPAEVAAAPGPGGGAGRSSASPVPGPSSSRRGSARPPGPGRQGPDRLECPHDQGHGPRRPGPGAPRLPGLRRAGPGLHPRDPVARRAPARDLPRRSRPTWTPTSTTTPT